MTQRLTHGQLLHQ